MSAILAAIVELEAKRDHIVALIEALRREARGLEASDPDPAVAPPRPRYAPKGTPDVVTAPPATTGLSEDALKVRKRVLADEDPLSTPQIVQGTRLPVDRVRVALQQLVEAGEILSEGQTSARRYRAPSRRSGPGAGTPSGSLGGVGPGRPVNGQEFETVWNGTKERNGEAPSILPPRERKP